MWCKRNMIAILPVIIVGWLNIQCVEGFGISSFGKASTDPPKPATSTTPPARQCFKPADCAGITGSSCVRTHYDAVTRCLCGDNQPPLNGQCDSQTKALYHACANSDECNDGLICGTPNITGKAPPHLAFHAPNDKICLCDLENGFQEKDYTCSGADILKTSMLAVLVVLWIRKIMA